MQLIVKTVGLHFSFSAFDMSHILCHVSDFIITLNQGSPTVSRGGSRGWVTWGSSGVTHITTSKKFHFYIIHIVLNKINVNLTEKSLDLVNFVGSADALQGGRGYYPTPYWRSLHITVLRCIQGR